MNKKDILFFNKKLKYTFHKSTPQALDVQWIKCRVNVEKK